MSFRRMLGIVGLVAGSAFAATAPVAITTVTLGGGTVNSAYTANLFATGGSPPYKWSVFGDLPKGLSLASNGTITGTPTTAGQSTFGIGVTDNSGASDMKTLSIQIAASALSITTPSPLPFGTAGVEYPQKILTASGGVLPYTFSISSGSLPAGLTLNNGTISGTPTTVGNSNFILAVTDAANTKVTEPVSISILVGAPGINASAASLSYSMADTAGTPATAQRVKVLSNTLQQQAFSVTVPSDATWLAVTGGLVTPAVLNFTITNASLPLAAGVYKTTVTLTCTSSGCSGKTTTIAVTLTITSTPARLKVLNDVISTTSDISAPAAPLQQQLVIRNSGGANMPVTSVICHAAWCSVGALPASVAGGVSSNVAITTVAGSLTPGSYRTTVDVSTPAGFASTPVTLAVPAKPTMRLPASGVVIDMPQGGQPAQTTGSFTLVVTGGAVSWKATASSTPAWLTVTTPSGTASPGHNATIQYSINTSVAAGLAQKVYYGAISIAANGVTNSPQDFRVVLDVVDPTTSARPELQPAGFSLTSAVGTSSTATLTIGAASTNAVNWQCSTELDSGSAWLTLSPSSGTTSAAKPGTATLTLNAAGLSAATYTASITCALAGSAVRSAPVTFVVTAAATSSVRASARLAEPMAVTPQATCSPTAMSIAQTGLVDNFSVPTAWPVPIAVNVLNNCGTAVGSANLVATFSNGDPPLALPLVDATAGLYAATWVPVRSSSQVTINTTAAAPGFPTALATIAGDVLTLTAPVLNNYAILNAFNPQVGAALAPGTVVAMYGSNLASGSAISSTVPLPTSSSGTQVFIGGIAAPIYYAGPGQINAQVPFELDPATHYQVVISANGDLTTPQTIQMTPSSPGVYAGPDTTVIAQHGTDYSLITSSSPAAPGEFIVLYVLGLGATSASVPSGTASPSAPPATMSSTPTVTIDGVSTPVYFAGLTPTSVGLYQINLQVPSSLGNGNHTLAVTPVSGSGSNSTLLPVHN